MVNFPSGPPKLQLSMIGGMYGRMEQRLVMTPPIASSDAEAKAHAQRQSRSVRELSDDVLTAVRDYIVAENPAQPYSDRQILEYVQTQGHQLQLRDVSYARHQLSIKPSSERYSQQ